MKWFVLTISLFTLQFNEHESTRLLFIVLRGGWGPPQARRWIQCPRRDTALVRPILAKADLYYKPETTELYPFHRMKDVQSLKDRKWKVNIQ